LQTEALCNASGSNKNQQKLKIPLNHFKSALIFSLTVLFTIPTRAQENLKTDKNAWHTIKKERSYDVLSKFDTVCRDPLLIYGIFGKNGYVGIIDHQGKEVTKADYHMIGGMNLDYTSNMFMLYDYFAVRTGKEYGVVKNTGELTFPLDSGYISVETYTKDKKAKVKRVEMMQRSTRYKKTELFVDGRNGKEATYSDEDYETVTLSPVDEFGEMESQGLKVEVLKDGSDWKGPTDISKKPNIVRQSPPKTHPVLGKQKGFFSKGHYIYEDPLSGQLGVANINTLKMVLPHEYTKFRRFFNRKNEYMFEKNGKQGIIDFKFNVRLDPKWDEVRPFQDNYSVRQGKFFAVLDSTFKRISKFKYLYNKPINYKMGYVAEVMLADSSKVLLNHRGKEILNFDFKSYKVPSCRKIKTPVIILRIDGGFKLLDINGVPLFDDAFQSIVPECNVSSEEGHVHSAWNMVQNTPNKGFYVKKDGKYGFINSDLNFTIPPSYRSMGESYYKDLLYVRNNSGWGVINSNTGKVIIPFESQICPKGTSGLIRTRTTDGYIYWNTEGEPLTPAIPKGEYIAKVYHGLYRVTRIKQTAIYFDEEGSRMDTNDTGF